MTVVGFTSCHSELSDWKNDELELGRYAIDREANGQELVPSTVACPYCHGPMMEAPLPQAVTRIAVMREQLGQHVYWLGQKLPHGYRVLLCGPCKQVFTALVGIR